MTLDEQAEAYNKGFEAGKNHSNPSPKTMEEITSIKTRLEDHIKSNDETFARLEKAMTPSNEVLALMINNLTKAIMGNGKPGLLQRMENMENWRSYMLGGMGIIVLLVPITVWAVEKFIK